MIFVQNKFPPVIHLAPGLSVFHGQNRYDGEFFPYCMVLYHPQRSFEWSARLVFGGTNVSLRHEHQLAWSTLKRHRCVLVHEQMG